MNRNIRGIIGVVVIVVCAFFVYRTLGERSFMKEVVEVHGQRAEAENVKALEKCRSDYQALLKKAPSAKAKKEIEGGIAACDAWIAYYRTTAHPSRDGYRSTIELMEKAKELTGDPEGHLKKNIADFQARLKEAIGPTGEEMDKALALLSKKPFNKVGSRLERIYYWKEAWERQKRFQDDKARQAALEKIRKYLLKGYVERFGVVLAASRKSDASLEDQAAVLGPLANINRLDKPSAKALERKHRRDLKRARDAAKKLEEQEGM